MSIRFSLRKPGGQEIVITGPFRIGRGSECQVQVDNGLVSRINSSIWIDHDHLLLRDERSRNGTFLNGRRLVPGEAHYLHHGDEVRVGDTTLLVESDPPYPRPRQHSGLPGQTEDEPPPTAEIPKSNPELKAALAKVDAAASVAAAPAPGQPAPGAAPAPAQRSLNLPLIMGGCLVFVVLLVLCAGLGFAAVTLERRAISTAQAPAARFTATPQPPAGAGGGRREVRSEKWEVGSGKWEVISGRQGAESIVGMRAVGGRRCGVAAGLEAERLA